MILGLGSDLVDIRRIEKSLERFGDRFVARVFTDGERARADRLSANPRVRASAYAKRFAAKEACAKALGTGFAEGVAWRDLSVVNLASGKPVMELSGGAAARLRLLTPPGMAPRVDVTMTDDYPLAQAMVIISAVPEAAGGGTP